MKSHMSLRSQAHHILANLLVKATSGGTELFSGHTWTEGYIVGDNRTSVKIKDEDTYLHDYSWLGLVNWVEESYGIYCHRTFLPVVGVGIWTDLETDIIYLDRVTLTLQRKVAKELAEERGEICVWDAENQCAIMTEDL